MDSSNIDTFINLPTVIVGMEKLNDMLIIQHELVKAKETIRGLQYEVEYWKEQARRK